MTRRYSANWCAAEGQTTRVYTTLHSANCSSRRE